MLTQMIALAIKNHGFVGATSDSKHHRRVSLFPCPIQASIEMAKEHRDRFTILFNRHYFGISSFAFWKLP